MVDRFIDFTATNNGDGTAANQAATPGGVGARNIFTLTDYPAGSTYDIWIRRAGTQTLGSALTLNQADVHLKGWPVSGDQDYVARPASGTSNGWDSDVQVYAQFASSVQANNVTISTGTGQIFRRIEFYQSTNPSTWIAVSVNAEFTNCHFKASPTTNTVLSATAGFFDTCIIESNGTGGTLLDNSSGSPAFLTCTFDDLNHSGAVNISGTPAMYGCVVRAKTLLINNPIPSPLHLAEFTQTASSTFGIQVLATATLVINNATFNGGNTNDMQTKPGAKILINNGIYSHEPTYNTANIDHPGVFSYDHESVYQAWKRWSATGSVEKDTLNLRTGGNPFSLKAMYNNNNNNIPRYYPLDISLTGHETIYLKLLPGTRTVTLYYTSMATDANVWFELEYLDAGSGVHKAIASSFGSKVDDTSVWTHPGTYIKRSQVTFSVGQRCLVPVRIFLEEKSTALTYIDPQLVVA